MFPSTLQKQMQNLSGILYFQLRLLRILTEKRPNNISTITQHSYRMRKEARDHQQETTDESYKAKYKINMVNTLTSVRQSVKIVNKSIRPSKIARQKQEKRKANRKQNTHTHTKRELPEIRNVIIEIKIHWKVSRISTAEEKLSDWNTDPKKFCRISHREANML